MGISGVRRAPVDSLESKGFNTCAHEYRGQRMFCVALGSLRFQRCFSAAQDRSNEPAMRCGSLCAMRPRMSHTQTHTSGVTLHDELNRYVNLKLVALGEPTSAATVEVEFMALAG